MHLMENSVSRYLLRDYYYSSLFSIIPTVLTFCKQSFVLLGLSPNSYDDNINARSIKTRIKERIDRYNTGRIVYEEKEI